MSVRFPEDERFPVWKINLLQYIAALTFLVLAIGYWRVQVSHNRLFSELAERNRVRNLPVISPRGRILDREGRVLVDNFPAFSILLLRERAAPLSPDRVQSLARGLRIDPSEIDRQMERTATLPRFQPLVLKQSASLEDIEFIESHRMEYPEIALVQVPQRLYPFHQVGADTLGYVGEVGEEMLAKPGTRYRPGDVVGMSGIEHAYNSILSGRDGTRRVIVDSHGREVGSLTTINAVPGNDLRLTLDLDLQMAAEAALGDREGAVVALDPRTGEILAMVSHPSFDPNDFARRIDRDEWARLTSDAAKPLMNKAIQAHLAPGSVFKVVTGTAALETGVITTNFTISCPGAVTFYGHTYHDWKRGHGSVNFHRALVISCDVYFYTLGRMLGIEKIDYFARALGLGAPTGVDLPGEDPGLIPSPEWVEKAFKRKWWAGETISVAIGQGAVAVTPIQLAHVLGGIASGGEFHRPHLAFRDQLRALGLGPRGGTDRHVDLSPTTIDALVRGMWGAVNEGGTGARARCPGIDLAGKTGTAQVVSADLQQSSRSSEYKNNAWFVAFSPSTKPEIVVSVLVMRGEHSAVAVPIARDIIKAYYEKKGSERPGPQPVQTELRVLSGVLPIPPLHEEGSAPSREQSERRVR